MTPRRLAAFSACILAFAAPLLAVQPGGDELRLVVILTRHGVRSPLSTPQQMAPYAQDPWPTWPVELGIQTEHGSLLVARMAEYLRARYAEAGLLTGDPAQDGPKVYLRADNDQRTLETARIMGRAFSGSTNVEIDAPEKGVTDPLFRPVQAHVGRLDKEKATAAVLGRLGGDPSALDRAYAGPLGRLRTLLFPNHPARDTVFDQPTSIVPKDGEYGMDVQGPWIPALRATEAILLEYEEGLPADQVAWGRVDGGTLTDLFTIHDLPFDLWMRTPYLAQAHGSNLASHIIDTLEQGALQAPVPGAIGPDGEKVVVLGGHDTNIQAVGAILGLHWMIPGTQADPMLPGGALIFELWRKGGPDGAYVVRVSYTAFTPDDMRQAAPDRPSPSPVRAAVFVPEASDASPRYDAPLPAFVRHARKVIDPSFISPE
jgi:4-phytase / acid phosphatase